MKVFLSAFRLLSKVKAAILATRTWYLSSDMPTRKYEKTYRANEIYKSKLRLVGGGQGRPSGMDAGNFSSAIYHQFSTY